MEEDLLTIEQQIADLLEIRQKESEEKPIDMNIVMAYIKYFLEHKIQPIVSR